MTDLIRLSRRLASGFLVMSVLFGSAGAYAASAEGPGPVRVASTRTLALEGALPSLTTLSFQDPQTGYAGGRGLLLRTHDAGRTWRTVWHGQGTVLQIDPISAAEAYAVTTRGLLRTTDGGTKWATLREPSGATDCTATPIGPCLASVSFVPSRPEVGYGVASVSPLVGTLPIAVLAAPGGRVLYVANEQSGPSGPLGAFGPGTVTAYDLASGRIAWDVPLGAMPGSMALSRSGTYLYVADPNSHAVSVVDTRTHRVVGTVPVAANPCALVTDPVDGDVFVASSSSALDVLSPGPRSRVLGRVTGARGGCSLAFGPAGKVLYAADQANAILAVDPGSRKVTRTFDVAGSPSGIAVSPNGHELYVAATMQGDLLELRASTGKVLRTWHAGALPYAVALGPRTGEIIITSGSSVRVIDPGTGTMRRVRFPSEVGFGVGGSLSPDGRTLYVPTARGITAVSLPALRTRALATSGIGVSTAFGTPALETGGTLVRTTDGGQHWMPVPGAPPVQTACTLGSGAVVAVSGMQVLTSAGVRAPLRLTFRARLQRWPGILPAVLCQGTHVAIEWTASNAAMEHAPYIVFTSSNGGRTFRPMAEENYTHIGLPGVNAPEGPGTDPGPFALTLAGRPVLTGPEPGLGTVGLRPAGATGDVSLPVPGARDLLSLSFPSGTVGYALTTQGRILATVDGGHRFTQLWPARPFPLAAIAFPTANVGYGLGTGGNASAVLKTVDGGRDWRVVSNLPAPPNPYGGQELAFVNANLGYAASADGTLYRTTDGGRHWSRLKRTAYQVAFDGQDGCMAGTGSGFSVSTNGGDTWQPRSGPMPLSLMGCAASLAVPAWSTQVAAFGQQAMLVGAAGPADAWFLANTRLYRTTNGGRTYEELAQEALGTTAVPLVFSFPPASASGGTAGQVGYLLTESGNLYRTRDGGRVWTDLTTPG